MLKVRSQLSQHSNLFSVQLFSALKRSGLDELTRVLNAWLTDVSVLQDEPDAEDTDDDG